MNLRTALDELTLTDAQVDAVRRLLADQPDADLLADALGLR